MPLPTVVYVPIQGIMAQPIVSHEKHGRVRPFGAGQQTSLNFPHETALHAFTQPCHPARRPFFSFLAIWFLKTPFVYFPTFHYLPFSNRISYAAWQRHGRKKAQMDENYVKSARNVADYNGAPRCVTKGCQTEIATRGQRKLKKYT